VGSHADLAAGYARCRLKHTASRPAIIFTLLKSKWHTNGEDMDDVVVEVDHEDI